MSFASSAMTGLGAASNGSRMLAPNDSFEPAPSWPASMIPGPAPVITIHPRFAISREKSRAAMYSSSPCWVRAEPKIVTLRVPL
jgi:hypothetical protein